jgi:hypothetical protein
VLGFAIVDSQSKADATAVWLTCREGSRVGHANAVVIRNDDERFDVKVWNLRATALDAVKNRERICRSRSGMSRTDT